MLKSVLIAAHLWIAPPIPVASVQVKLTVPDGALSLSSVAQDIQPLRLASVGIARSARRAATGATPPLWPVLLPGLMSGSCFLLAAALAVRSRKRPAPGRGRAEA